MKINSPTYIIILILAVAITTSVAQLVVRTPTALQELFAKKYKDGQIPYSLANFGEVPYGKTIIGEMSIPSVLMDCVF
jgi:hypothetical protein